MKNNFVAIEGLDCSGKSSVIYALKAYFKNLNINNIIFTRDPGGNILSEKIRKFILKKNRFCSISELLMMYASRIQNIEEVIKPAFKNNKDIISDRYFWSSIAYQGAGLKIGTTKIKKLNRILLDKSLIPNLTIYLDIKPETAILRIKKHRNSCDLIEKENLKFFTRVRNAFLKLVEENILSSVLINAEKPLIHTIKTTKNLILQHICNKKNHAK